MKSRTRLSRSRSIRDAVELISIEWNDGNENTEREREEGVHRFDSKTCAPEIVVLVRRCTDARALIRLLPAESHLPHTFSFVAGGGRLSLGGERGREGEGREQRLIREKKIRFRESTNEAFSFRRRRLMKT